MNLDDYNDNTNDCHNDDVAAKVLSRPVEGNWTKPVRVTSTSPQEILKIISVMIVVITEIMMMMMIMTGWIYVALFHQVLRTGPDHHHQQQLMLAHIHPQGDCG